MGSFRRRVWAASILWLLCIAIAPLSARAQSGDDLDALNIQVVNLYNSGRFVEAEPIAKNALALAESRHGASHERVIAPLNNLALLYQARGRYADAEPLFKRSLTMCEALLGPDHAVVGSIFNSLGEINRLQGRFADAEPLYKRSIGIYERALAPDRPEIATALNNLALVYQSRGRYAEAEPLYQRSLAIYEKALGPAHPVVGTILNNLAEFYRFQGRHTDAEPLYKRSLAIYEKAFGPERAEVARTLNNLALLYYAQGRFADAEPLSKRSLAIYEKALGPEHPEVGTILNNQGELYRSERRFSEAEPLYTRAIAIYEKAQGRESSDVARTLNNLALLYHEQGRFADAEPIYKDSLAIYQATLGPDHPEVGLSLNNLGEVARSQGRLEEAEPLYKRSLAIYEKALGPEHPDLARPLNNLALLLHSQGRFADAEPLYKRSLAIYERALGPNHPQVASAMSNLAALYTAQERRAEADALTARVRMIPGWEVADIPVFFATNRDVSGAADAPKFGTDQILDVDKAVMGEVVLRAPKSEVMNRAQRGADALGLLYKAQGRQTSETALSLHRVTLSKDGVKSIFDDARKRLARASRFPKHALVFVHGYNNSFEDAVRRAAMISFDLDFDGFTTAFAWPARSGLAAYMGDRERAQTAAPFLTQMLEVVGRELPDVKVHIISHSTGSEVVLTALEKLADRSSGGMRVKLGEVIFAHADVNATRLTQLTPSLRKLGVRVTSYSSKEDLAMRASDLLRMDGKRVGGAPVYLEGVDAIDISGLGERFSLNHTVFVQNPMVFNDIARLMATGERPPQLRTPSFVRIDTPKGTHWEFKAATPTAARKP